MQRSRYGEVKLTPELPNLFHGSVKFEIAGFHHVRHRFITSFKGAQAKLYCRRKQFFTSHHTTHHSNVIFSISGNKQQKWCSSTYSLRWKTRTVITTMASLTGLEILSIVRSPKLYYPVYVKLLLTRRSEWVVCNFAGRHCPNAGSFGVHDFCYFADEMVQFLHVPGTS